MLIIPPSVYNTAEEIYNVLQPYCKAIYLGGSRVNPYINNPHDYDYIIFTKEPVDMCNIRRLLYRYLGSIKFVRNDEDFIQIRNEMNEENEYGSWINKLQVKLIGENIQFKFDIINENKNDYMLILKKTLEKFRSGKIRNEKRWYQIYQGICIMKNRSYKLTDEQIFNVNMLHDMATETEEKRFKLIEEIVKEIELWQI